MSIFCFGYTYIFNCDIVLQFICRLDEMVAELQKMPKFVFLCLKLDLDNCIVFNF